MPIKITSLITTFFVFLAIASLPIQAQNLPTVANAETLLQQQIQLILDAGYLRPTYMYGHEFYAADAQTRLYGNNFNDFWHNPAETLYTLSAAYPFLNTTQQIEVKAYLQDYYADYKPYQWSHTGMAPVAGAKRPLVFRETSEPPPIFMDGTTSSGTVLARGTQELAMSYLISSYYWSSTADQAANYHWDAYQFNPYNFYGLYHYAKIMGNAGAVLAATNKLPENYLSSFKTVDYLKTHPFMLNLHIAGYYGYLGLQQLAGQTKNTSIENSLANAQALRLQHLREVDPANLDTFEAGGFLYLVPELGQFLYSNDPSRVALYLNQYSQMAPYWLVARAEDVNRIKPTSLNEGNFATYYDYWASFQAKAYALKESRSQLETYLDVPVVPRGDLFYIQNLVAVIQADPNAPPSQPPPSPTSPPGSPSPTQVPPPPLGDFDLDGDVDFKDFISFLPRFNQTTNLGAFDLISNNLIDIFDFNVLLSNFLTAPSSLSLSNLTVQDTANAADWSLQTNIKVGDLQYGDRTFTLASLPPSLVGKAWLKTANDSRNYTGTPLATVTLNQSATVYIAHDDRIVTKPSWLGSFTDTGDNLVNSEPQTFSVYTKTFPPGTVTLGPNSAGEQFGMYTVIVN